MPLLWFGIIAATYHYVQPTDADAILQLQDDGSLHIDASDVVIGNSSLMTELSRLQSALANQLLESNRQAATITNLCQATSQQQLLVSPDASGDYFGGSIAIDNGTLVVGARGQSSKSGGSAYVFRRSYHSRDFHFLCKLNAADTDIGHLFGNTVAISGGIIVVGAVNNRAAYVFAQTNGSSNASSDYEQIGMLQTTDSNNQFGQRVAVSQGTIVVGARANGVQKSGAAYLFQRNMTSNQFEQVDKLMARDATETQFGYAVAIENDVIVVGSYLPNTGAAYVFERRLDGNRTYQQILRLVPDDAVADDRFGITVAMSDDVIVVGTSPSRGYSAVYLFQRTGRSEYRQVHKMLVQASGPYFNSAVSVKHGVVAVRTQLGNATTASVAVLKLGSDGDWIRTRWLAPETDVPRPFGEALDIDDDVICMGAYYNGNDNKGATYVNSYASGCSPA